MYDDLPPFLSIVEFLEEQTPDVEHLRQSYIHVRVHSEMRYKTHVESDETEICAEGNPEGSFGVINDSEEEVDDSYSEGKHSNNLSIKISLSCHGILQNISYP
jgi:hypothetical protein